MSKIRSKEKDEIEEYFSEIKNKNFPTWILFIILFILIIGGIGYYYFVIDSPKNIFLTIINNNLLENTSNKTNHKTVNYQLDFNTNIKTTKKEYLGTIDILKEIALSATGGVDLNTKENVSKLNTFYKGEKLIDIDLYSKENTIYFKLPDLYNKVIKVNNNESINTDNEITEEDYKKLINSLKEELTTILKNATYKKEYTNLNDNLVKKVSLLIDKTLTEKLYNNLMDNKDFIESYSKIQDISTEDTIKEIKDEIDDLDNETNIISLYLSIFDNKFIMFETITEENRLVISKEDNKYEYKIYEDSIIFCQGYLELNKVNNSYEISFALDDIEEEISIILNLDLSLVYDKNIEVMDVKDYINYNDLTENDENQIMNNLSKNKTLLKLIDDINSLASVNTNQEQTSITA